MNNNGRRREVKRKAEPDAMMRNKNVEMRSDNFRENKINSQRGILVS